MTYTDLIRDIQTAAGLTSLESRKVLDNTVEAVAALLDDDDREDFASQLPGELQYVALDAEPVEAASASDLLTQFIERQQVDEDEAKTLIGTAWRAIVGVINGGEAVHIRSQLPGASASLLN